MPRQVVSPGTRSVSILLLDLCHASIQSKNSTTGIFPTYLYLFSNLLKPPIQLRLSFLSIVLSITLLLRHQALSLWDGSWPPFAAEIRLELWKVTEATRLPMTSLSHFAVCQRLHLLQLHCRGIRWILGVCVRLATRPGHFLLNVMLSSNL